MEIIPLFDLSKRIDSIFIPCGKAYIGKGDAKVKQYVEDGLGFMAYYTMTKENQDVANLTKDMIFISPNKYHYHPDPRWDDGFRLMSNWWMNEFNTIEKQTEILNNNSGVINSITSCGGGSFNETMMTSRLACNRGTAIHEKYGAKILDNAVAMYPGYSGLKTILPGRVVWNRFSLFGCTPDGLTVPDEDYFEKYMEKAWNHNAELPVSEELKLMARKGAPHFFHEIKTLWKSKDAETGIGATVSQNEGRRLKMGYEKAKINNNMEEFKKEVVKLISIKYAHAGYIEKTDMTRTGLCEYTLLDKKGKIPPTKKDLEKWAEEKEIYTKPYVCDDKDGIERVYRLNNKGERVERFGKDRPGLFKSSFKIALTDSIDYSSIKMISGDIVRHLANHEIRQKLDQTNEEKEKKKKRRYKTLRDSKNYPAKKVLFKPGKCRIILYNTEGELNDVFKLDFKTSPFRLSVNGEHFRQSMTQMATCMWLNPTAKHIYTSILSYEGTTVKPAIQISWEQGFTKELIDDYVRQTANRIGEVDQKYWGMSLYSAFKSPHGIFKMPNIDINLSNVILKKDSKPVVNEDDLDFKIGFEDDEDVVSDDIIFKNGDVSDKDAIEYEEDFKKPIKRKIIQSMRQPQVKRQRENHEISDSEDDD